EVLGLHVPMPELDAAFPAAARWQASRVLVSSEVDNRSNTRTGVGKEPGYDGKPKGINQGEVTMALTLHGLIYRDPVVMAASDRAFAWVSGLGLERSGVDALPGGIRRHRVWTTKDACEALLYEVPTGGHHWPANLGDPGKSTATEIAEFFERHGGGRE
ncbi:MAG: hypothetical protein J0L84_11395, partial [Verrucomicrobia bacterium]|nr:hypothetical protein [Verrucomicrobiota bacterium]